MTEFISSWEKFAKQEGIEEGVEQGMEKGMLEMVFRLLEKRCGKVSKPLRRQISDLSINEVEALFDAAIEFDSIKDLRAWLKKA